MLRQETMLMKIASTLLMFSIAFAGATAPAFSQTKSGVEKLYIITCGEGVAANVAIWSPGVNVGKPQPFADSCYLIKHAQGWFLWDTGITDAIAAMTQGQPPASSGATHWYRPVTLAG